MVCNEVLCVCCLALLNQQLLQAAPATVQAARRQIKPRTIFVTGSKTMQVTLCRGTRFTQAEQSCDTAASEAMGCPGDRRAAGSPAALKQDVQQAVVI